MVNFWLCFIPLFVAVDPIGILPMFMALTEGLDSSKVRRSIIQSVITATIVVLLFLTIGKMILNHIGVTMADFMIAGGILLFILSLSDLLSVEKKQRLVDSESLGAVPLGVPLIAGPAVLTTTIILLNEYGIMATVSATIVNIIIAGLVFWLSESITRILGNAGTKTVSKIASLFLAAIAVMMVRKGIIIVFGKGV